jgi:N-acetylmuramoyl-L-alanine amidase
MIEVTEAFLSVNPYSRPGIKIKQIKGLVLHYIQNPGTSARMNRNYFESLKTHKNIYASSHFIIDLSGEVFCCVPMDEVAYHCGENRKKGFLYTDFAIEKFGVWPNAHTIGIEFCHLDLLGHYTEETVAAGYELCSDLCELYNLDPVSDIVRHYDITGKLCPRFFVDHPQEFEVFKRITKTQMLRAEVGAQNGG